MNTRSRVCFLFAIFNWDAKLQPRSESPCALPTERCEGGGNEPERSQWEIQRGEKLVPRSKRTED